jgi:osmotically-inducible protein OsmY
MAERWDERNRGEYRGDRSYAERERHERGVMDRAGDEVRSWFGDDEASRRRRMDEQRGDRYEGDWGNRASATGERAWERSRDAVRDMTDRDRDGRRGMAEWNDDDRSWDRPRTDRSYGSGRAWTGAGGHGYETGAPPRQTSFGNTSRYANTDPYPASSWTSSTYSIEETRRPSYTGRGPRGYQRTDDRIREDVCDMLTDDHRVDASDIDIQVSKGEVTLAGSVRTREEKRFTEDIVERVSGVREVNNNLKVRPADDVIGTARSGSAVLGLTDTPPPPASPQAKSK